jgi:hypothetical protein
MPCSSLWGSFYIYIDLILCIFFGHTWSLISWISLYKEGTKKLLFLPNISAFKCAGFSEGSGYQREVDRRQSVSVVLYLNTGGSNLSCSLLRAQSGTTLLHVLAVDLIEVIVSNLASAVPWCCTKWSWSSTFGRGWNSAVGWGFSGRDRQGADFALLV